MILYDPACAMRFSDYGIMLPVSPVRAEKTLEYLAGNFVAGSRGFSMPYPGPVFDIEEACSYLGESASVIVREDLERVHSKAYISVLFDDTPSAPDSPLSGLEKALLEAYELIDAEGNPRRYEPAKAVKPLRGILEPILRHVNASYLACRLALAPSSGFCFSMGGGMHHARYDGGSGFCLVNDIAAAARKVQAEGMAGLVWILDLDAHKGDGTTELVRFARERGELAAPSPAKPDTACILTLSIHMARGWPLDQASLTGAVEGRAPIIASDVEIGIEAGEEASYVSRLAWGIDELEQMSGRPDLIIVVDGADPYEYDELPSSALLKLTLDQCLERDIYVYRYATERNIPSAWIEAGGYGERSWEPAACFLSNLR